MQATSSCLWPLTAPRGAGACPQASREAHRQELADHVTEPLLVPGAASTRVPLDQPLEAPVMHDLAPSATEPAPHLPACRWARWPKAARAGRGSPAAGKTAASTAA
mmetsp:Transcript_37716/g.119851  ORF Transcript_37716/g.119851 Transcript_37716/m.119851 type:complete len:106 (+) Transcript_37716:223-540(+)